MGLIQGLTHSYSGVMGLIQQGGKRENGAPLIQVWIQPEVEGGNLLRGGKNIENSKHAEIGGPYSGRIPWFFN